MEITCGIYLYSIPANKILICHATKSSWKQWSIPKGLQDEDEDQILAAKRELYEETNINLDSLQLKSFHSLPERKYKTGKKILVSYLAIADFEPESVELNCHSLVQGKYPEVDKFRWVKVDELHSLLHHTQVENLELIKEIIENS